MARTKKAADTAGVQILADTAEQEVAKAKGSTGSDVVYIACGMPLGLKFDDVDNGHGGNKVVTFPGVNHALRGKAKGILLGEGNAVLVTVSRADWEDIKRKHGKERAFVAYPPLLWEMASEKEFKARRDEIADMKTGVAPVDPDTVGGIERKDNED